MIDSIINRANNLLNKLNRKNFSALLIIFLLLFVFYLRANAMNLSSQYSSDLESDIENIPTNQLSNTTFFSDVPVSIYTIEGNEKSIIITYVTLINLISGEYEIDLSEHDEFNSVEVKNYYLPGKYKVYVTIENDILILLFERSIGDYGKL